MMQWYGVGASHQGFVRPTNQDAFLVNTELQLWAVADGMGRPLPLATKRPIYPTVNPLTHRLVEGARPALERGVQVALRFAIGNLGTTWEDVQGAWEMVKKIT